MSQRAHLGLKLKNCVSFVNFHHLTFLTYANFLLKIEKILSGSMSLKFYLSYL